MSIAYTPNSSMLRIECSSCGFDALSFSTIGVAVDTKRCGCGGALRIRWGRGKIEWVPDAPEPESTPDSPTKDL